MTVNKRKKNTRQRGHKTHGWGAKKKHRGHGHKGGTGMAGSGKRADSKKPSLWKERYFGKYGFISKTPTPVINPVNLRYIEEHINQFISKGLVKKEHDVYFIELEKLGFNKLLGEGKISLKFKIKTPYASKSAVEKVKESGGEVIGQLKIEKLD